MSKPRKRIINGRKYCTFCGKWVVKEQFGHKEGAYDKLSNWCKPCLAVNATYNRKFNPKYKAWYKKYYTPERIQEKYQAQKALWKRRRNGSSTQ